MNRPDLLQVYHFADKIRYGVNGDGGYVLADLENDDYDCYISAGVSDEESFSRDFINNFDMNEYNSFAFDGTIQSYPHHYTNKITFTRKNIGGVNDDHTTNLEPIIRRFKNIFLKMDVEGGEYPWLLQLDETQLQRFKQIAIEFHGITGDGWNCSCADKMACLEKLAKTHYIVHAHANNYGSVVGNIPDVIELTYVNKNCFAKPPKHNETPFPIPRLDFCNNMYAPDIPLTSYPFVHSTINISI